MLDLKVINSVLGEFEQERGIPRDAMIDAIESALATAYKKEYGKRGQIVRAKIDLNSGTTTFFQVKVVVDESRVRFEEIPEGEEIHEHDSLDSEELPRFDPEKHILLEDAKRIKRDAELDAEIVFPLEAHEDFGRIAAQTAKQVIIQKIREAEKLSILGEYGNKKGEIVSGSVQRIERGTLYVDLGRATGVMPYEEQIPGERYRQGERIRAYLYAVDEGFRGVFLRLSRSHPRFVVRLFEQEAPELASGVIEIKAISREPGSRTKLAVLSSDPHVDPVGSLVGQRGVRVSTVMSELGGERIDIIEWSENTADLIRDALSPADIVSVELNEETHRATVSVTDEQQSLAIGRGGQNVRLAAKLTGWAMDMVSAHGGAIAETDGESVTIETSNGEILSPDTEATTPSQEAGITETESNEIITNDTPEVTTLPAEEELSALPDSDETVADQEENRDPARDQ